ncbi:hypothetical protein DYB26_004105 [Aphanomyces astaci]|uniref:Chitin-binding type-4 domain-containing protein n=1 Tax=Aphanomyces astaci TaxID=112090 RepID=A0A418FR11_APHAT|nr:hypothetical protein DYB26_004105 [Aphanomyces astaci]
MKTALCLVALATLASDVLGHGHLLKPPHRGYIGRLPGYQFVPINYSDNGLSAGGIGATKDGLHGVCGDPYTDKVPRPHENGGLYGTFATETSRAIGACYSPGSTVDVTVQVTANHMGYFEFGLCKLNKKDDVETETCFQTLAQPTGETRWPVPAGNLDFTIKNVLPKDVTCEGDAHCVLRWHYVGGNNWNGAATNPNAGVWGQEHFWNCADIYISNTCGAAPLPTSAVPVTTQATVAPTTAAPVSTAAPVTTKGTTTVAPVTAAPTTAAPATTKATTLAPVTPAPTSAAPGDKCQGNRNTCYWPEARQTVPYAQSDCALFPTFVWCP